MLFLYQILLQNKHTAEEREIEEKNGIQIYTHAENELQKSTETAVKKCLCK